MTTTDLLATAAAALGLAAGFTAFTALSIRYERPLAPMVGTFLLALALLGSLLWWAQLPADTTSLLAWTGAALTLVFGSGLRLAKHMDKRWNIPKPGAHRPDVRPAADER